MKTQMRRSPLWIGLLLLVAPLVRAQVPAITALNPPSVTAGGAGFTLSITGTNFLAAAIARVNGANRTTLYLGPTQLQATILASDITVSGSLAITVFNPVVGVPGGGFTSNTVNLVVNAPGAPPPTLVSATPEFASPGASDIRLTLIGTNFRAGAHAVVSPPLASVALSTGTVQAADVFVENTTVVNPTLIVAIVAIGEQAPASLRAVDVLNLDGTNTGTSPLGVPGTSKPLRIAPNDSLGAPLNITTIALLNPRDGSVFSQGEEVYGQAELAATGSGVVIGAWFWDNNVTEQFTVNVAGGQSVTIHSQNQFPTELLGAHTVQLRIFQPNHFSSRPINVVVNPGDFSIETLLAPGYGARVTEEPPVLRWTPVPGISEYEVGFATQPYYSEIKSWHSVAGNTWLIPEDIWRSLPDGELYWTVRSVEMSGAVRKPLPMRLLLRFPNDALKTTRESPSLTPQGNPLLEWKGLQGWHVYRVTISSDPAGERIVRRYLTGVPQIDLRALRGKLDATQTYHWFVEVLDSEGRTILTGPTNVLVLQNSPQSRNNPARGPHLVLASYLQPVSVDLSDQNTPAPAPSHEIKTIANRVPAPNATASNPKAPIVIDFSTAPNVFDLAIQVDDTDATSLCDVADTKVTYKPAVPITDGVHSVVVTLGSDSSSWKFTMKALSAAELQKQSDAESGKGGKGGNAAKTPKLQTQTQIATNTQWVSGSAQDTNATSLAEQLVYQDGPWKVQLNGTGLLSSVLGPEDMRTSLGHFNNYVVQGGMQKGAWGLNVSFGMVAPALYKGAQFVTTATPRQGVEADLKTPAGAFDFYANTDDVGAGSGIGYGFHQQLLGASWDLPLPKKYVELRLMWLSAHDTGTATTVQTGLNGQTSTVTDPLAVPGGGDLYGALLQVHLAPKWLWTSEYAWGYNDTETDGDLTHLYGRAARTNVAGTSGPFTMNVSYLDVSPNFASPVNPNLSPNSTSDRRGPSGTFVFTTRAGTFSFGDTYLQSNFNESNFAEQEMNSVVESWTKRIDKITTLTLAGHETFTTTGDVPPAVQALSEDARLALEADQRDAGANLSITRQVDKSTSLTFSGARDWFRNNLVEDSNTITSSLIVGANWVARSYFQLNANASLNWIAGQKSTVGTTRSFSAFFQPTFTWKRAGLQLHPLASINQTRTVLLDNTLTNDLLSQQYGGRLSWTMPSKFKFSTLTLDADHTDAKNPVASFRQQGTTLYLLWTISWGCKHQM